MAADPCVDVYLAQGPARGYAAAFLLVTVAALVVDAVLQLALAAVRVSGSGGVPWWITANLAERGRWVVLAALLWWLAPRLMASPADEGAGATGGTARREAWKLVGVAAVVLPLLWVLATWVVTAMRITLLASWSRTGASSSRPNTIGASRAATRRGCWPACWCWGCAGTCECGGRGSERLYF